MDDSSVPTRHCSPMQGGMAYELAAGLSVSKENFVAFHNDWSTRWANELQFALHP
jgi:hypothetical protein